MKLYNSIWGFLDKPVRLLWTESESSRGGVTIILNPYSLITALDPWQEDHWTLHWMAVQITILGGSFLVVSV
uniref:Uncharacterized protein n=1 Tax=Hyaloperonospora arabidopsidis (strain Emoy2) TaxID=559515 RepID=M4C4Z3_HYAAE